MAVSTSNQTGNIGLRVVVIDPLSDERCAVVTGSHNFSGSASEQNDENFVIVRRDRRLAEAYAVACLSTYRHYRWRAYVKDMADQGKTPFSHLDPSSAWHGKYLLSQLRRAHLLEWCP